MYFCYNDNVYCNIEDKKTVKAIKAVLDALGLDYNIDKQTDVKNRSLNKSEQVLYNRLKRSTEEIKLYQEGKIELQDASEFLNEL